MRKTILVLVAFILVLSIAGIARTNPAWASVLPATWQPGEAARSEAFAPPLKLITITQDGIYNVGGVCTVEVDFLKENLQIIADAEVPIEESKKVIYPGDANLLFPGCHFVHFKDDEIVNPLDSQDGTAEVCFGASSNMVMSIWYYLDSTPAEGRVWQELPTWLEDNGRLVCASAKYTGVYMPTGKIIPRPGADQPGGSVFFPGGIVGSVVTPPSRVEITSSGSYAVGGICLLRAEYFVEGLSDTVEVEYPPKHYTEETLTVPSEDVKGLFYFPGCHVIHYEDQVIRDQMFREEGEWEICFAEIPGKVMTIYYYRDNLAVITPPWIPLESVTENGMVCANLVDFSAVYVPGGE